MNVLVIDVGGTNVKIGTSRPTRPVKIPSGKEMTAARMAAAVLKVIDGLEVRRGVDRLSRASSRTAGRRTSRIT